MNLFIIFLIGLCFGSFASVIIHRLHTKKGGIIWGRSKCPKCHHVLSGKDLIPLLSWLFGRFKCRYCAKPVSSFYPILELVMGLTFLMTAYWWGIEKPLFLAYYFLLTFVFVTISFYDILFQEIPDELSLPTIILAGLFGVFGHLHTLNSLGIGFLIPVAFFGSLFLVSRGRWLGGGDIRIGAIMGFVLGWPGVIVGLFIAYLTGSIYSAIGLISGKLTRKSAIPFGPFLFLGTYVAMIWGDRILNWYLRLI